MDKTYDRAEKKSLETYDLVGIGSLASTINEAYNLADSKVPSPDFTLSSQINKNDIPLIVVTSRGCPHDCSFCSVTPIFGRKYRFKSHGQVIEELCPVQHKSICFGDDNFCANPKRAKALMREMIKRDAVPLRWSGQMCVSAASDNELLELMEETRCRVVYVGIESVDPQTLKKYGRAHSVDAVKVCVENLHKHILAYMACS